MSAADQHTGSGGRRFRRLLSRAALAAGGTLAATAIAWTLGSGTAAADQKDPAPRSLVGVLREIPAAPPVRSVLGTVDELGGATLGAPRRLVAGEPEGASPAHAAPEEGEPAEDGRESALGRVVKPVGSVVNRLSDAVLHGGRDDAEHDDSTGASDGGLLPLPIGKDGLVGAVLPGGGSAQENPATDATGPGQGTGAEGSEQLGDRPEQDRPDEDDDTDEAREAEDRPSDSRTSRPSTGVGVDPTSPWGATGVPSPLGHGAEQEHGEQDTSSPKLPRGASHAPATHPAPAGSSASASPSGPGALMLGHVVPTVNAQLLSSGLAVQPIAQGVAAEQPEQPGVTPD
ncbi:hypothetical protein [Actinoalloteichus caeruleus]|uniref:hypothetical protein n=1 Tax=Actinoalloteichus cyanogriseus TaxID=2893586 RepID=UPI000555023B|nr:hypothetical protein [Actinoalloteichus caeruleus]